MRPTSAPIIGHGGGDEQRAALDYSEPLVEQDHFYAPLYGEIVAWLDTKMGCRILDAGCGAGGMTGALAVSAGIDGSVVALDIAAAHLAATRAQVSAAPVAATVTYVQGSVDAPPFADESFDLIWCSHVIHGQPDQLATVAGLRRLLAPGGRLALREDFRGRRRLFPHDVGLGAPGLELRILAHQSREFDAWRAALPGAVHYHFGWLQLLQDAGLRGVTARTFAYDLLPPFAPEQEAYLAHGLTYLRADAALRENLSTEDREALDALTDPDNMHYALRRPDLYLADTATVYVGSA
jgi:SAM-dependent methyltransferase